MKKLLLTSVLALSFVLQLSAFAGDNIFGVSTPIEKNQVNSNVNGGYVAGDLNDTFHVQELQKESNVSVPKQSDEKLLVFGVDIKAKNLI